MTRVEIGAQSWGTVQDALGNALQATATIKTLAAANATHYSAITGGTSATSSLVGDANGMLTLSAAARFIEEGPYTIDVPALGITGRRIEAVSGDHDYDKDNGQSGVYGSPGCLPPQNSLTTLIANRLYACRFVPSRDVLVASCAYGLGVVSTVDDSLSVGFYNGAAGGSLVAQTGVVAAKLNGVAGRRVINMVTPGWLRAGQPYYSCLVAAVGGTAAQLASVSVNNTPAADLFGVGDGTTVAAPHLETGFFANGSTTLPGTLPTLGALPVVPVIAWREF